MKAPDFVSKILTINASTPIGEVGTLITDGRSTDGDGLDSTSRRVAARITVVVARSDGKVHTSIDRSIHSIIESLTLATTVRECQWLFEVGDRAIAYPRLMLATDPLCAV